MLNLPFTLRQLDVFASLAATRSFRRSAELLGISQASVSSQIKALESQLGVTLFDRAPGRRPVLRPAGLAFLDDLAQFQQAAAALASHRRTRIEETAVPHRFRVLVGQGMFDAYVRRKLDTFYSEHSLVELEFELQLPFGKGVHAVESGGFDFALIHHRADRPLHPQFTELARVRGGIYGHRKFAEGEALPLDPARLNSLPFILPKATSKQEQEVMRNYQAHGIIPRKIVGQTQYYDVMAAMLDRGLGVASLSEAILPPIMRDEVVLLFPMQDWRLLWFRKSGLAGLAADAVQDFLITSVLDDPAYPVISRNWL